MLFKKIYKNAHALELNAKKNIVIAFRVVFLAKVANVKDVLIYQKLKTK